MKNKELKSKIPEEEVKLNRSIYNRHMGIIKRCYNPNDSSFFTYGGKGITMCEEWLNDVKIFTKWCKENGLNKDNYKKLEIDRIDSSKGYYPENCRFLTKSENILRSLNLSESDVRFIRSEEFDWSEHRNNYNCSDNTLNNIINYKTFRGVV